MFINFLSRQIRFFLKFGTLSVNFFSFLFFLIIGFGSFNLNTDPQLCPKSPYIRRVFLHLYLKCSSYSFNAWFFCPRGFHRIFFLIIINAILSFRYFWRYLAVWAVKIWGKLEKKKSAKKILSKSGIIWLPAFLVIFRSIGGWHLHARGR